MATEEEQMEQLENQTEDDNIKDENREECILRGKQLKAVPPIAWKNRDIYKLSLQGNKLKELPSQIRRLKSVQILILSFNAFDTFPLIVCELKQLHTLCLSRNRLKSISLQICQLTNLRELRLSGNLLPEFPEALTTVELNNLELIHLYDNKITEIPEEISRLVKLKYLNINDNKVTKIPESFCELKNLEKFKAQNNKIKKLPPDFGDKLSGLQLLELNGNPLVIPPLAVCQKGIKAIKTFQDGKKKEAETALAVHLAKRQADGQAETLNGIEEKAALRPAVQKTTADTYCIDGIPAYRMTSQPRGIAIVINNHHFKVDETRPNESRKLPEREGTQFDKEKLQSMFSQLKFDVRVFEDLSSDEIMRELIKVSQEEHQMYDTFACCILSHGSLGTVYGSDGISVKISDITGTFVSSRCPGLRAKPKLFFIQACQNEERQDNIEEDAVNMTSVIPDQADFLLGYATVPGFVSYRHTTQGSWYVGALVQAMEKYCDRLHLLDILTIVNDSVAMESSDGCVQVPAPQYTLRKRLYLSNTQ
ncbi:uncharacterized protein LOC144452095 [Glandiceps talaboti]